MRELKFNKPYKIHKTTVDEKSLNFPEAEYYGRFSTIITKSGIVTASELNWKHNNGRSFFTLFTTVLDGFNYSAWLDEAKLSDRQLKWMASYFINKLLKNDTGIFSK